MLMNTIQGYYGSGNTPCNILTAIIENGSTWYCVEGSENVNLTNEPLELGVDVETVCDIDNFTWNKPIESEDELEHAINY